MPLYKNEEHIERTIVSWFQDQGGSAHQDEVMERFSREEEQDKLRKMNNQWKISVDLDWVYTLREDNTNF